MGKGTVIMYGIPAYGHINSNLYLMRRLTEKGFRVIYYATDQFQDAIEKMAANTGAIRWDSGRLT